MYIYRNLKINLLKSVDEVESYNVFVDCNTHNLYLT